MVESPTTVCTGKPWWPVYGHVLNHISSLSEGILANPADILEQGISVKLDMSLETVSRFKGLTTETTGQAQ